MKSLFKNSAKNILIEKKGCLCIFKWGTKTLSLVSLGCGGHSYFPLCGLYDNIFWWTQNRTQYWWRTTGFPERYENVGGEMEEVHQRERTAGLPTSAPRPTVPSPRTPRRCFLWPPPPPRTRPCVCNYPINSLRQSVFDLLIKWDSFSTCPCESRPALRDLASALKSVWGHTCLGASYVIWGPKGREMILWEHPFPSTAACFHSLWSALV